MARIFYHSLLFLSTLAISCSAQHKAEQPQTDPYFVESTDTTSTHGPACIVRDVLQDKMGTFWLATWQGIMGYNGHVFTNYTLKEDLIHFHVVSLYEDNKGNLWFGTARGGVYRYDGRSFQLFTTDDGLADNTIMCMAEDKAGNMWFGTEYGASRFDGTVFVNFTTEDGLPSNYVNSLLVDQADILWLGCDGLCRYDGKTFSAFTKRDHLPFARVASLLQDKAGTIWIGSMDGLCRYDGKSLSDFIVPKLVMYMCEDENGNLLCAYSNFPENQSFVLYRYDGNSFSKLIEQNDGDNWAIFGMIEDTNGDIWYGSGRGVYWYDGKTLTHLVENNP